MLRLPGHSLGQKIHEGHKSIIYRARAVGDQRPVVVKVLRSEYLTPRMLAKLRQEYETLRALDLPGVIKAHALEKWGPGLALVMEDGGVSLREVLERDRLALPVALRIALSLANTLAALHAEEIVHKDIKPHNILVHEDSGVVKLTDFGIAMRLSQETARMTSPDAIEGTLAYISPEQSGRMNRVIDQRTDLYSLGITLYEMLTGSLPFSTANTMELIHSHIARLPVPPRERSGDVPQVVSDIVMKLLAKAPEDRYQTALGLAADLGRCVDLLDKSGDIPAFELGQRDFADVLRIPQKLYGRAAQVEQLMQAFARVREGRPELLLVTGDAGVGKSVLVNEVHKPIARDGGSFISGKFDIQGRGVPLSALAWALRELVRQLLTESSATLAEWRTRLLDVLGSNGQLMIDLVPDLELVIGRQAPVPTLGPTESQNRFGLVFKDFVRAFCSPARPLVIFLDDLQWADPASLSLLQALLTDPAGGHLLIVGSYRDTEVDDAHPLRGALVQLQKSGVPIAEITLQSLDLASICELLTDSRIGEGDDRQQALAQLVHDKTHGNPFFVTLFLLTLQQDGLLRPDRTSGRWTWDPRAIGAAPMTDHVVEFMSGKLTQLPPDTQRLLALAACLGHQFDLATLASIAERTPQDTSASLWPALRAGLVVPLDSNYRLVTALEQPDGALADGEAEELVVMYRFLHDRVQHAALSLIEADRRKHVELRIGRALRKKLDGTRSDALFDVVRHLNVGAELIEDPAERRDLAQLNLEAGRAAKEATAFSAGAEFLAAGLALLSPAAWDDDYALTFALHRERAECNYLSGRFDRADAEFEDLVAHARSDVEKAQIYSLRTMLLSSQGRFADGLAVARIGLQLFGVELPTTPEETGAAFGALLGAIDARQSDQPVERLLEAPVLEDPAQQAVMRLLNEAYGVAFVVDVRLGGVVILKHVLLSLTHGHTALSAFGYACFAYILAGPLGRAGDAAKFGSLAMQLLERLPSPETAARVHFMVGFSAGHTQPLSATMTHFTQAQRLGLEAGDFMWASQGYAYHAFTLLRLGTNLDDVRDDIDIGMGVMQRTQDVMSMAQLTVFRNVVDALQNRAWWGADLNERTDAEAEWLATLDRQGLLVVRALHHVSKLLVLTIFEEYERARALMIATEPFLPHIVGAPYAADYPLYAALTIAGLYPTTSEADRPASLSALYAQRAALEVWARNCPENDEHRLHLIDAELARVTGDDVAAMIHYDRAIELARKHLYHHDEALANELCARFHLARGRAQVARVYLHEARFGYERWGATAKANDLQRKYAHALTWTRPTGGPQTMATLTSAAMAASTSSLTSSVNLELDLASVVKASQAVAAEIELQPLLENIIHIMLENAGAKRGVLLLHEGGRLRVVTETRAESGKITLVRRTSAEPVALPMAVINFVEHTGDSVILHDAVSEGVFTRDRYIVERRPRSLLCAPLIHKGKFIGAVYLENDLTPGVFSSDRLKAIKLIAAQAAISVENARLYQNLDQAREAAVAADRAKTRFLMNMSHELRTPLSVMIGYTELIEEEAEHGDIETLRDDLQKIRASAGRLLRTLTSILELSKIEAGRSELSISELDMEALVREVVAEVEDTAQKQGNTLAVVCAPELGRLWSDRAMLRYCLLSLLDNACRFTTNGRVTVEVARVEAQGSQWIRLIVRDTGVGIPREYLSRLFDSFSQADDSTTRDFDGAGVSLAVTQRFCHILGGSIDVESEVGLGSTFVIRLPASDAPTH